MHQISKQPQSPRRIGIRATFPTHAVGRARGFTLIELMVALTGSLLFTVFVFMLSRDVSRYFQGQTRLSETTLAAVTGFERLRADIARAGYMASPNLSRDRNLCPRPAVDTAASAPTQYNPFTGLEQMGLLRIIPTASSDYAPNDVLDNNAGGILPDKLVLYGNYTTAEQFPIERIIWGSPIQMVLERNSIALNRVGITTATTQANADAILQSIFRAGHILRLVDTTGRVQYAIVQSVAMDMTGPYPVIDLENSPTLIRKQSGAGVTCGIRAACTGCLVNPVDIIRYELIDGTARAAEDHTHTDFLYQGAAPAYDDTRLDLFRYQLTPDLSNDDPVTTAVAQGSELIMEYAVDMKFGLTALTDKASGVLTYYGEDDLRLQDYAGVPYDSPTNSIVLDTATYGPHFIRGVHARVSVRNREADRTAPILTNPGTATSGGLFRIMVAPNQYARMRTLRSHIATRNSQTLTWN